MDRLRQDLRYATRMLRKNPSFTVITLMTLAMGIGATTAIFSIVYSLLIRPLPYPDANQLDFIRVVLGDHPKAATLSGGELRDLRQQSRLYVGFAAFFPTTGAVRGDGPPEQVDVGLITPNLFPLLGVSPALGRAFQPEEDLPGGPRSLLISDGFWRRRYGADPAVVGRIISLDGDSWTIVGVLAPGTELYAPPEAGLAPGTAIWRPIRSDFPDTDYGNHTLRVIARRAPGVETGPAQRELNRIAASIRQARTEYASTGLDFDAQPLHSDVVERVRPALIALMLAVAFVLLIACSNVASLLLARGARRQHEMALRSAIGASRWRVVRQFLTESLLLSFLGGALGVVFAVVGVRLLVRVAPHALPMQGAIGVQWECLLFAVAISMGAGLLFGTLPALKAYPAALSEVLKEGGRTGLGVRSARLRTMLMITEVTFALVLLVGAGLFVRSFMHVLAAPLGFAPEHVLTIRVALPRSRYTGTDVDQFLTEVQRRLSALPGVRAVGASSHVPLGGRALGMPYAIDDRTEQTFGSAVAEQHLVTPGYLEAMGTHVLSGRTFTTDDALPGRDAVVVDAGLARAAWPGQSAIGKRVKVVTFNGPPHWMTVIGVVEHVRHDQVTTVGREQIYYLLPPNWQMPLTFQATFALRTATIPASLAASATAAIHAVAPQLPTYDVKPMTDYILTSTATARLSVALMGTLACLATVLAMAGVYGLMSYTVAERMNEFGIRVALGAQPGEITLGVVGHVTRVAIVGAALGLVISWGLSRFAAGLLFEISPTDPITLAGATVCLLAVAVAASWIPARHAARADPLQALRSS